MLFVRGTIDPCDSLAIAVVGARHATKAGQRIAHAFAMQGGVQCHECFQVMPHFFVKHWMPSQIEGLDAAGGLGRARYRSEPESIEHMFVPNKSAHGMRLK